MECHAKGVGEGLTACPVELVSSTQGCSCSCAAWLACCTGGHRPVQEAVSIDRQRHETTAGMPVQPVTCI